MSLVWERLIDDVRRDKGMVLNKDDAAGVEGARVAPLGGGGGKKKVRINDYSFDPTAESGQKEGEN